jgi:hypothetical protein
VAKATTSRLVDLHNKLAEVMLDGLEKEEIKDEEGNVVGVQKPSAAIMAVAVTFLKNNNITADPETNAGLSALQQRLQEKRAAGKTKLRDMEDAANWAGGALQ